MKLTEPECFVLFEDVSTASQALNKLDDHRLHAQDRWGIMVGFARSIPRSGQTILSIEEEESSLPEVYVPEPSSLPEVYHPPGESSLPEVYHPELLLRERQLSMDMDMEMPTSATSRRGRFAQLLAPRRSSSKGRRRSIGSLNFSDAGSMNETIAPLFVVDVKREKQKEKQEKKERKAKGKVEVKEREIKLMTTDHNVRWGP